jgi:hypothetical protein
LIIPIGERAWKTFGEEPIVKRFVIILLLASMASCSNDQQQTHRQLRALLSWSATADMVLDAQAKMLVPSDFTALALERCGKEIGSLSEDLSRTSPQDLTVMIGRLNEIIGAAHEDIVNDRTGEISRRLEDLRAIEASLKARPGATP